MSSDTSPTANAPGPSPPIKQEFEGFDEFDPRFSDTGKGYKAIIFIKLVNSSGFMRFALKLMSWDQWTL